MMSARLISLELRVVDWAQQRRAEVETGCPHGGDGVEKMLVGWGAVGDGVEGRDDYESTGNEGDECQAIK
jgi:hypothetical protein